MGSIRLLAIAAACAAIGLGGCARWSKPDLAPQELLAPPTAADPGAAIDVAATIQNLGGRTASAFDVEFGLFARETDAGPIGRAIVKSVASGLDYREKVHFSVTLVAPETAESGTYYVCAIADRGDAILEKNETNNRRCAKIALVGDVDLKIERLDVRPTSAVRGQTVQIVSAVRNYGRATGDEIAVEVGLYADEDDDAPIARLTDWRIPNGLKFDEIVENDIRKPAPQRPALGAYFICAVVDPLDDIAEADEDNNRRCVKFSLVSAADLAITRIEVAPSTADVDDPISIRFAVANHGRTVSQPVVVDIGFYRYASDAAPRARLPRWRKEDGLMRGETAPGDVLARTPTTLTPGPYYVCAIVDAAKTVLESDETNNRRCARFDVGGIVPPTAGGPDLAISGVDVSPSSSSSSGAAVRVFTSVKNNGGRSTGAPVAIEISLYARQSDRTPVARLATDNTASIEAGGTRMVVTQTRTPAGVAPGVYYICAVADPANHIREDDETNNRGCARFELLADDGGGGGGGPLIGPDLKIDRLVAPRESARDGAITIAATVRNNGTATGKRVAVDIGLYVREADAAPITTLAGAQYKELAPGRTEEMQEKTRTPKKLKDGDYFICAVADPRNDIVEIDETNNRFCVDFALPPGTDFVIDFVDVDPAVSSRGEAIFISSAVRNDGRSTTADAEVDIKLYAREDDASPILPESYGRWRHAGGLKYGERSLVKEDELFAPTTLGHNQYYVCAVVDPQNRVKESVEDNNRRCTPFTLRAAADLVTEKVTPLRWVGASLEVGIRIKNAGVGPAKGPFRIKAFRRAPRAPLMLTACPLTEGQLAAGSPSGCADLTVPGTLAAGAAADIVGYFNYLGPDGGAFPVQPIRPGGARPPEKHSVDFMVDGCFPPVDLRQVWCAVDEIDEINNFKGATLTVR